MYNDETREIVTFVKLETAMFVISCTIINDLIKKLSLLSIKFLLTE